MKPDGNAIPADSAENFHVDPVEIEGQFFGAR